MLEGYRRDRGLPPPPSTLASGRVADLPDRTALFAEVRQFLTSLTAKRPSLIVLEDLHWSDEESLDLLRNIGPHVWHWPVLLLATYRMDELLPARPFVQHLPALVRESDAERLELGRLDRSGLQQLVGSRYALPAGDEGLIVEYLDRFSEGNPFFAVELMRVLEEEHVIESQSGTWSLGELDRVVIPTIVNQTIDRRIRRLGDESRKALDIAAVIG